MTETSKTIVSPSGSEILVGGQALLEGVMMRTPAGYGVAVRRPDGSIALDGSAVPSLLRRMPILRLPLLRGVAILGQSLALGFRALNFSASVLMDDGDRSADGGKKAAPSAGSGWLSALSTALAVAAGLLVFLFLPLWLTQTLERWWLGPLSSLSFNLIDGAWRGIFFLGYLLGISRLPDIHRVFMYHGAEHKVVFSQEYGEDSRSRTPPPEPASPALWHQLPALRVAGLDPGVLLIPRELQILASSPRASRCCPCCSVSAMKCCG